jgi:hypothetical protein
MKNGDKRRVERVKRVTLLLSEGEKEALEAHAQRIGVSLTAAVRLVLQEKVRGFVGKEKR